MMNAFLNGFSSVDLDEIEKEISTPNTAIPKSASDASLFKKKSKRTKSITRATTITTGKIKREEIQRKLKRCAGGYKHLNITNKASSKHLQRKSQTLRKEKAEIQAIAHSKQNNPKSVIVHRFSSKGKGKLDL